MSDYYLHQNLSGYDCPPDNLFRPQDFSPVVRTPRFCPFRTVEDGQWVVSLAPPGDPYESNFYFETQDLALEWAQHRAKTIGVQLRQD